MTINVPAKGNHLHPDMSALFEAIPGTRLPRIPLGMFVFCVAETPAVLVSDPVGDMWHRATAVSNRVMQKLDIAADVIPAAKFPDITLDENTLMAPQGEEGAGTLWPGRRGPAAGQPTRRTWGLISSS